MTDTSPTPKELTRQAMALEEPSRVPAMCQLAIGHTLLQTGISSIEVLVRKHSSAL